MPKEEIGYIASEEYAARLNSPSYKPLHSNHSQPHVESPLRKSSFPIDSETEYGLQKKQSHTSSRFSSENALESETDDDEGPLGPAFRNNSDNGYDGGNGRTGSRGRRMDSGGALTEDRGYAVPILASDEVARTPFSEFQQPAVSPSQSRRGSAYYSGVDSDAFYPGGLKLGSRSGSASNSRPSSRPGSIHSSQGLQRFSTHDDDRENMHTPLEDVDEYEPLFPDEDGNKGRRPFSAADRLKLREQMKRFPSKDIWEDTPNSLQLQATVETPEPSNEQMDPVLTAPAAVFETPEQESARKGEVSEDEKAKLIPKEQRLAKSHFKPHLRNEMLRPGLAQRFPSRDIWEDSPDSARLETTVADRSEKDLQSPTDEGLEAGAVVTTSGAPNEGIISGGQPRDNATIGAAVAKPAIPARPSKDKAPAPDAELGIQPPPAVPARPPRRLHQVPPADAQVPVAPSQLAQSSPTEAKQSSLTEVRRPPVPQDRKPQLPARPAKVVGRESSETIPLSQIASTSSDGTSDSPPLAPKPKPTVPARPAGSKIASLKAGFMSDLDSRLRLRPQGLKPQEKADPEVDEEKAPLTDARKGRAKGPARRKPVSFTATDNTEATAGAESQEAKATLRNWSIRQPWTVWEHHGILKVGPETSSGPEAEKPTLDESSNATQASTSSLPPDSTEEAQDILKAKQAVEDSLASREPLSQQKVDTPLEAEEATNKDSASLSSSPAAVISPIAVQAQEHNVGNSHVVNPGTEEEGTPITVAARETQG